MCDQLTITRSGWIALSSAANDDNDAKDASAISQQQQQSASASAIGLQYSANELVTWIPTLQ